MKTETEIAMEKGIACFPLENNLTCADFIVRMLWLVWSKLCFCTFVCNCEAFLT